MYGAAEQGPRPRRPRRRVHTDDEDGVFSGLLQLVLLGASAGTVVLLVDVRRIRRAFRRARTWTRQPYPNPNPNLT